MSRKLPKAITRTSEDMREIAAGARANEKRKTPVRRKVSKLAVDEEPAPVPHTRRATVKVTPAPVTPPSSSRHDPTETKPTPTMSAPALIGEVLPAAPTKPGPHGAGVSEVRPHEVVSERRTEAHKIVERHKIYAAVGGLIPVPIANVAGVTAVILRMVKSLSELYGVPFERDRVRSFVMGLMGGAVPTGLGAAAASTLASLVVPGSAIVGLAVSSVAAATLTHGIGLIFVESFESGTMPLGGGAAEHI